MFLGQGRGKGKEVGSVVVIVVASSAEHSESHPGLYDHCQSYDLDLHSRSQVHLKLDYFLTSNISNNL